MKKLTAILASISLVALFATSNAYGAGYAGCQPIYGGGETCVTSGNLLINKTVQTPFSTTKGGVAQGAFVDNLSVNDSKFAPGETITFKISVTNSGDAVISNVTVTDTLPVYVSFVAGPGNFDSNTKKLTFQVTNLNPGETREFTLTGKVADSNTLPSNQTVTCDVNQAQATADNGQKSTDNAQFCVEKQVVPTTKGGLPILPVPQKKFVAPETGPEMLALIGLIPSGLAGLYLRKRTSK